MVNYITNRFRLGNSEPLLELADHEINHLVVTCLCSTVSKHLTSNDVVRVWEWNNQRAVDDEKHHSQVGHREKNGEHHRTSIELTHWVEEWSLTADEDQLSDHCVLKWSVLKDFTAIPLHKQRHPFNNQCRGVNHNWVSITWALPLLFVNHVFTTFVTWDVFAILLIKLLPALLLPLSLTYKTDYCNSLLLNLPAIQTRPSRRQLVLNSVARTVTKTTKFHHTILFQNLSIGGR